MKQTREQKLIGICKKQSKAYREMSDSWAKLCRNMSKRWHKLARESLVVGLLSGILLGLSLALWIIMLFG